MSAMVVEKRAKRARRKVDVDFILGIAWLGWQLLGLAVC